MLTRAPSERKCTAPRSAGGRARRSPARQRRPRGARPRLARAAKSTGSASSARATCSPARDRAIGARTRCRVRRYRPRLRRRRRDRQPDGTRARPDFKPCWDPYLFAQQPYFGRSVFRRRDAVAAALAEPLPSPSGTCCGESPKLRARSASPTCRACFSTARARARTARTAISLRRIAHFERSGSRRQFEPVAAADVAVAAADALAAAAGHR